MYIDKSIDIDDKRLMCLLVHFYFGIIILIACLEYLFISLSYYYMLLYH